MKKILILALLCSAASGAAIADVPAQFNYQGRLTKQDGSSIVDGEYSVTFTIYDAPEAGNVLWQDINPVTTKEGFFNTIIGAGTNKLDLSGVDFSKSLYLGIRVATDAEMTPRVQLVGVPYAMQAKSSIMLIQLRMQHRLIMPIVPIMPIMPPMLINWQCYCFTISYLNG